MIWVIAASPPVVITDASRDADRRGARDVLARPAETRDDDIADEEIAEFVTAPHAIVLVALPCSALPDKIRHRYLPDRARRQAAKSAG